MPLEYLDQKSIDRRVFIKGLGWVSAGLLLSTLGGCESCAEQIANRPTRRRLRIGSADVDAAIAIYKDAVTQMKALPGTDPRSWDAQAAIHGSAATFNFCEHGTDHFFSWHRAYLFYFEQICQTLTGETGFGLPYWNWNQDHDMHPDFTDAASPLNHSRVATTVGTDAAFSDSTLDTILADTNFLTYSPQLEGTPHNGVHNIVGLDMASGASPLDPIFWAHHCMVDYCWDKWNLELGNDNPSDPAWVNTAWSHFVDGQGNPVSSVIAGGTTLYTLFNYQYESSAIGSFPAQAAARNAQALRKAEERLKKGAQMRFDIKRRVRIAEKASISIARPFSSEAKVTAEEFSSLVDTDTAKERVFANVDYAQLPPTNDFFVRVFLNLPGADGRTPTTDPHYAGSFAFFGTHSDGHKGHGRTEFLVNVTETLRRLKQRGDIAAGKPLSMQLVAVPVTGQFAKPDAVLLLEGIDLVVSPVLIRTR